MVGSLSFNEDKCTWTDLCPRRTFSTQLPATDDANFIVMETDRGEFVFENLRAVNGIGLSEDINFWYGEDFSGNSLSYVRDADGSITGRIKTIEYAEVILFDTDVNGVETSSSVNDGDYYGDSPAALNPPPEGRRLLDLNPPSQLFPASPNNIITLDLMIVWSAAAEEELGLKKMKKEIVLAVEEVNASFENSGVDAKVNVVTQYKHPTYQEDNADGCVFLSEHTPEFFVSEGIGKLEQLRIMCNLENDLSSRGDGKLDDVMSETRERYGADVVVFIFKGLPKTLLRTPTGGKVPKILPEKENAFILLSYVSIDALAHELGHILVSNCTYMYV